MLGAMAGTTRDERQPGGASAPESGPRVLLIEDNLADARLTRELLNEANPGGFDLVSQDRLAVVEDVPGMLIEHLGKRRGMRGAAKRTQQS